MNVKPVKHAGSGGPLMALPSMLKGLPDMERGITRIFHRTANPAEFVQVLQALVSIAPQLGVQVSMLLAKKMHAFSPEKPYVYLCDCCLCCVQITLR